VPRHLSRPPELAGYFPHWLLECRASTRVLRHDRRLGGEIGACRPRQAEVPIPAFFFATVDAAPAQPGVRTHYRPRGPDPLCRLFRRRFAEFRAAYEQRYAATFGRFRVPLIVHAPSAFRVCGDWSQCVARIAAAVFRGIQAPPARLRPVLTLLLHAPTLFGRGSTPPLPLVRPEKNSPAQRVPQREPAAAPAQPTGGAVARHRVRLDGTQSPTRVPSSRPGSLRRYRQAVLRHPLALLQPGRRQNAALRHGLQPPDFLRVWRVASPTGTASSWKAASTATTDSPSSPWGPPMPSPRSGAAAWSPYSSR